MSTKRPIFVIDSMLGNLAKKLRILGYDSTYFSDIKDEKLVVIAKNEKRVLVTKDEQLVKIAHNQGVTTVLIRGNDELEQIMQINANIKLEKFFVDTNNSRCTICNGKLQTIEKYRLIDKIPDGVLEREEKFWVCDGCKKIYWQGTHFKKLQEFVDKLNKRLQ